MNDDRKVLAFRRWDEGGAGDDVIVAANFQFEAQIKQTGETGAERDAQTIAAFRQPDKVAPRGQREDKCRRLQHQMDSKRRFLTEL